MTRRLGRCELFDPIARGGMASLHLGRWLGSGGFRKIVAIKALHPQHAKDDDFVKMFLDEARVVARIRHPNVVPILDLWQEDGELFIVMDFVEGVTLAQALAELRLRKVRMPVSVIKRVMVGVLQGLHAAHEATDERGRPLEVIHRDVSPDNVLIGTDGHAHVIDFGIAKATGRYSHTASGVIKGKLAYLAPEQLREQPLSRRTDVYGASVVMWQALTGTKLFQGRNAGETALDILERLVPRPGEVAEGIDASLDEIVMRGLDRDADLRWESAAAMAEAIEAEGGLASYRAVGEWLRGVAGPRLDELRALIARIEAAPISEAEPARRMTRTSLADAPVPVWPTSEAELSRTQLTGEGGGAREVGSGWRRAAFVAAAGAGLVLAGLLVAQRSAPYGVHVAASGAFGVEVAPAQPALAPPPTATSSDVAPPPAASAVAIAPWTAPPLKTAPAPTASATVDVRPPATGTPPPVTVAPSRRLPDGI
ncbi:MAG: serine/threonine-protein kinase [Polyangiaceae bacterium]